MIKEPTLFITGAGASAPYGYPTGEGLRKKICLEFSNEYSQIIIQNEKPPKDEYGEIRQEADRFTSQFLKSSTPSIDQFLATREEFSQIGKYAIAYNIIKAEIESKFWYQMNDPNEDWYVYLFRYMTKELNTPESYTDFRNNKVTFITFNYDRSLEFFLYTSFLNKWFGEESDFLQKAPIPGEFSKGNKNPIPFEVQSLSKICHYIPFPFHHVYGKISELHGKQRKIYPMKNDHSLIKSLCNNIRIIYERTNNDILKMKEAIISHKRIFFLGFGYAEENLEALELPNLLTEDHQIFGTAYRFSEKKIRDLKGHFAHKARIKEPATKRGFMDTQLHFENLNCRQLLETYL